MLINKIRWGFFMGAKMGRPTKLTADFIEKASEYMAVWNVDLEELIPSIAGLAVYTKVSRDSLHSWAANEWPEGIDDEIKHNFSDIIKDLAATQELKLMNGGLGGTMNPTITKLILHKHGHTEKTEVDNTSSDGSMSPAFDSDKYKTAQSKLDDLD